MEIKKETVMWLVIGILIVLVIFLTYKITTTEKAGISGNAIDTRGWSENEIMNYEMHGTIPARLGKSSSASTGGMVGGC